MADEDLVYKVRRLGDIDLAALLCLISREHCIISTDAEYLDDLTAELQLVAERTFGLSSAVVDCTPETTLDDLVAAIQLPQPRPAPVSRTPSPLRPRGSESYFSTHYGHSTGNGGTHFHQRHNQHGTLYSSSSLSPNPNATPASPSRTSLPPAATQQPQIANIVLARNLDTASEAVQIQCLELMRTRRILRRTAVQACPKQFLLVAVLGAESAGMARLTRHLNNHFYISHWQDPEDGFMHLDEERGQRGYEYQNAPDNIEGAAEDYEDDVASQASSESVVRRTRGSKTPSTTIPTPTPAMGPGQLVSTTDWAIQNQGTTPKATASDGHESPGGAHLFTEADISKLSTLNCVIHIDIEVQRYLMNVIAFLRLHRAVTPGTVAPAATTHFQTLVRSLAALHGLDFVTPELVQLAARKIYAHRIAIVPAERERSMQWGSDLDAVKELLEGVEPEDVIEEVLASVDVPL
ncbi:hypothetical protein F5Y14DRAFT_426636 [Nemania sp. NC0429]|nr:hypothetical protein F5Y14DRAFT_426636 [Nemania sp. NC0429]